MAESLLLDTLAWAVRRMRDLQRTVESDLCNLTFVRLMRAAEAEVDELVALHTLPELPLVLPPIILPPEGGAK